MTEAAATEAAVTESARVEVAAAIRSRQRFVITSHVRPDGDAIGSALALAAALRQLGKDVRVLFKDPAPEPLQVFPGVGEIEVTDHTSDPGDAVLVMECGDVPRTGIDGLAGGFVVNIDHHPGNTMYGAVNWIDLSAAACGEMVYELIRELGVPLTLESATHIYVAILTDTGSFHYSNITPRTFEICRHCMEVGIDPPAIARSIFDSSSLGRLKLLGAVLNRMELDDTGRIATISVDRRLAAECGGTYEDTEGLINMPLTVKAIQAVVFFKESGPDDWRVSLRSKGDIDVNGIARQFGGGGHTNASGCSARGSLDGLRRVFRDQLAAAMDKAGSNA